MNSRKTAKIGSERLEETPERKILKAKKYLCMREPDIVLLSKEKKKIKRATKLTILKKMLGKNKTIRIKSEESFCSLAKQLNPYMTNFYLIFSLHERSLPQHIKSAVSALKHLNQFELFPASRILSNTLKMASKLRKLNHLVLQVPLKEVISFPKSLSYLTKLTKLRFHLITRYLEFLTPGPKLTNNFSEFCQGAFHNKKFESLEVCFEACEVLNDFELLVPALQSLNQVQASYFCAIFDHSHGELAPLEELKKLVEKADSLTFMHRQINRYSFYIELQRKAKKKILFTSSLKSLDNVDFLLESCKNLDSLTLDANILVDNFPKRFGKINSLISLKIKYPAHEAPEYNDIIESVSNFLSEISSLENLTFESLSIEQMDLEKFIQMHKSPCLFNLKSYELLFRQESLEQDDVMRLIEQALTTMEKLENLKILITNLDNQNTFWSLIGKCPQLKSLNIAVLNCRKEFKHDKYFKDLSKMQNLEKLALRIPCSNSNKTQILKQLPKLSKLVDLSIKIENYDRKPKCIDFNEYKQYQALN